MLIEVYFQEITKLMSHFESIKSCEVNQEKRGLYEGFIRAKIIFIDQSYLHIREFVDVEFIVDRKMYSYQYMTAEINLKNQTNNYLIKDKIQYGSF